MNGTRAAPLAAPPSCCCSARTSDGEHLQVLLVGHHDLVEIHGFLQLQRVSSVRRRLAEEKPASAGPELDPPIGTAVEPDVLERASLGDAFPDRTNVFQASPSVVEHVPSFIVGRPACIRGRGRQSILFPPIKKVKVVNLY